MQRNNILRQTKAHDWPSEGAHPLGFTSSSCTSCLHHLHHRLCFRWVLHIFSQTGIGHGCSHCQTEWVVWLDLCEFIGSRSQNDSRPDNCVFCRRCWWGVGGQGCDEGHKQGTRWHLFLSSSLCSTWLGGSPSGPFSGPWSPELVQLPFWGHHVTLEWPHHMWHTDTCLLCWQERQKICTFWSS